MTLKDFIFNLLSEENKFPSSKRVISIVGSFTVFGLNIAYPTELFVNATTIIVCGAIGVTGVVSIFKRNNNDKANQNGTL